MAQGEGIVLKSNLLNRVVFPGIMRDGGNVIVKKGDLKNLHRDALQAETMGEFLGLGTAILGAAALYSHINLAGDIFGSTLAAAGLTSFSIALYAAMREKSISAQLNGKNNSGVP